MRPVVFRNGSPRSFGASETLDQIHGSQGDPWIGVEAPVVHHRRIQIRSLLTNGSSPPESRQVQNVSIFRKTPFDEHSGDRQDARLG
jgi:hypothetical protein